MIKIVLTNSQRDSLLKLARSSSSPHYQVLRAKIILMLEKGLTISEISRKVGLSRKFIRKWKNQYIENPLNSSLHGRVEKGSFTKKEQNIAIILKEDPRAFGIKKSTWSIASISMVYYQKHGEIVTKSSAWRIARKLGYKFNNKTETEILLCTDENKKEFLTKTEHLELENISRKWTLPYRKVIWARTILLANSGLSNSEVGRRLGINRKIVSKWVKRYSKTRQLVNFSPKNQAKKQLHKEIQDQRRKRLLAILHDRPSSFEINRASWTCLALSLAYSKQYGEQIGKATVHRLIQQSGYAFRKARRVLTSPDPDYREKVELLLKTLRNLSEDEYLFFIDEMGPLRIKKYGGRTMMKQKEIATIPQVQADKGSIIMSAALNATKNQVTWLYSLAKDTQSMIDLIEILFNQYQNSRKLYVTWDAASWHRSSQLVNWLDTFNAETVRSKSGPTIHLVPLPTSAQFLDVIEAVFSGMKRAVIHHSDYSNKWEMKTAISRHFLERNQHFVINPKRAGEKIWDIDFFQDLENITSGNYREW